MNCKPSVPENILGAGVILGFRPTNQSMPHHFFHTPNWAHPHPIISLKTIKNLKKKNKTHNKKKAKILFSSQNYTWISFFVPELWKIRFSSLNFEKFYFYTWISSFYKKSPETKFICKNKLFYSSEMKNETHV